MNRMIRRMSPALYVLIFILYVAASAFSQSPGVTISAGTQISADNATNPHAESFLAINPKDQKNWLATAIVVENGGSFAYPCLTAMQERHGRGAA